MPTNTTTLKPQTINIQPIGYLRSPFKEKFGIPRQPGLITSANASIEFVPPYDQADAFIGLEGFSHIWLSFIFHQNKSEQWRPKVRPPRLGGNEKLGVFATRSSFRPNGIGLSVVELKRVEAHNDRSRLIIACPDIVDGTPIIDIKPYVPYSDSIDQARSGFATNAPNPKLTVAFSAGAQAVLENSMNEFPQLKALIEETLSLDPRPAYKAQKNSVEPDTKTYGIRLYDFDVKWNMIDMQTASVTEINHLDT